MLIFLDKNSNLYCQLASLAIVHREDYFQIFLLFCVLLFYYDTTEAGKLKSRPECDRYNSIGVCNIDLVVGAKD